MIKNKVNLLYEDESYKIRGVCFRVYNALGGGIKELISQNMSVEIRKKIDIIYEGEKIGVYIPDLIINNKILIELKSKPFLIKEDEKQFWGYLKGLKYELGFLINFGPQRLTIKRFIHTNKN